MPRPRIPNFRKQTLAHKQRIEQYTALIQKIYDQVTLEGSRLAKLVDHDSENPFSFDDYPLTKKAFQDVLTKMREDLYGTLMTGTSNEWKQSNMVQDMVANKVLTAYTGTSKNKNLFPRYYQTNPDALKAFQQRKIAGMNLSTRVWNLTEQFKPELEMAISSAIAPGTSAQLLSQQVKQYLNEPDLMFRRFRYKDENGHWKKKWKKRYIDSEGNVRFEDCDKNTYKNDWTGKGYYKSSAKNAKRLARTEINMAYRTAEQERWKQFDFVVGYEVHTTQNGTHDFGEKKEEDYKYRPARLANLAKVHKPDICDQLEGKYPKDFNFIGWHPQCLCYAIPILKTEDEFWNYDEEDPTPSENEVTDVPQQFKDWVSDNRDRITKAEKEGKSIPYFLSDNKDYMIVAMNPETIKIGGKEHQIKDLIIESTLIQTDHGKVYVHPNHGKNEKEYNESIAKWLANEYDEEIILLPTPHNITSADSYNITRKVIEEYKNNITPSTNSIDTLIRKGNKQANYIILEINSNISPGDLEDALKDRVQRCKGLKEIRIKIGSSLAMYKKDDIDDTFKIKLEDFKDERLQSRGTRLLEPITNVKLIHFLENTKK